MSSSDLNKSNAKHLVQKYFNQLTLGCGKLNCKNVHCASSGEKFVHKDLTRDQLAAQAVKLIRLNYPICSGTLSDSVRAKTAKTVDLNELKKIISSHKKDLTGLRAFLFDLFSDPSLLAHSFLVSTKKPTNDEFEDEFMEKHETEDVENVNKVSNLSSPSKSPVRRLRKSGSSESSSSKTSTKRSPGKRDTDHKRRKTSPDNDEEELDFASQIIAKNIPALSPVASVDLLQVKGAFDAIKAADVHTTVILALHKLTATLMSDHISNVASTSSATHSSTPITQLPNAINLFAILFRCPFLTSSAVMHCASLASDDGQPTTSSSKQSDNSRFEEPHIWLAALISALPDAFQGELTRLLSLFEPGWIRFHLIETQSCLTSQILNDGMISTPYTARCEDLCRFVRLLYMASCLSAHDANIQANALSPMMRARLAEVNEEASSTLMDVEADDASLWYLSGSRAVSQDRGGTSSNRASGGGLFSGLLFGDYINENQRGNNEALSHLSDPLLTQLNATKTTRGKHGTKGSSESDISSDNDDFTDLNDKLVRRPRGLDWADFVHEMLNDIISLDRDYIKFASLEDDEDNDSDDQSPLSRSMQSRRAKFAYLRYPFMLTAQNKTLGLFLDNRVIQMRERRSNFIQMIFSDAMQSSATSDGEGRGFLSRLTGLGNDVLGDDDNVNANSASAFLRGTAPPRLSSTSGSEDEEEVALFLPTVEQEHESNTDAAETPVEAGSAVPAGTSTSTSLAAAASRAGPSTSSGATSGGIDNYAHKIFLKIKVRRDHIIEDATSQLEMAAMQNANALRRKLFVEFEGEPGLDDGGPQKEFFQLVIQHIFNPDFGMFVRDPATNLYWFNPLSQDSRELRLIGMLLGLALYNNVILDVSFPPIVFRKLLGAKGDFEDLKTSHPVIANSLEQLVTYTEEDFEELGETTFQLSYTDVYGGAQTVELFKGGASLRVDPSNVQDYVNLYADMLLNRLVRKQFRFFKMGFDEVTSSARLLPWLLRPDELELCICGLPDYDLLGLEAVTKYEGFTPDSMTIKHFWKIWRAMERKDQERLLVFATGSSRVPVGGLAQLSFSIVKSGSNTEQLPSAHTCYNVLILPDYKCEESLRTKLNNAIQHCHGFGLV